MVAQDDVDMETLQAEIDMSMSFAHSLVTSWIKPSHLVRLKSTGAQILEEELRRPPRLGVGAFIPAVPSLGREASQLKHRLNRSKKKNRDAMESKPQDSSKSDDEEHKGRPAKRKPNVDPFGHEPSKKKGKASSEAKPFPSVANNLCNSPTLDNLYSRKYSQWSGPGDQRPTVLSETCRETSAPVSGRATESSQSRANSMFTSDETKPLGIQLLNLDGPPEQTDKPGNNIELNHTKRKRKRRKKKKIQMTAGTGGS